jgi:hypothetical protein
MNFKIFSSRYLAEKNGGFLFKTLQVFLQKLDHNFGF